MVYTLPGPWKKPCVEGPEVYVALASWSVASAFDFSIILV